MMHRQMMLAPALTTQQPCSSLRRRVRGSALPDTFQRLLAPRTGGSFREAARLHSLPLPSPGPGQALVRVRWAGVNGGCETFRVRGEHWFAANRRACDGGFALGAEGAGEVVLLGDSVTALVDQSGAPLQVGDAVVFVGGAFSEYVLVQARCGRGLLAGLPPTYAAPSLPAHSGE
jgi:NADPH:quinone reductase-like Zn-dependent oxidoreductase